MIPTDSLKSMQWFMYLSAATLISCSFKKPFHYRKGDQIFLNGYQTWTDTREYELSEEVHSMNRVPRRIKQKYHFEMYGDSWFWKYHKKSCHSFTYSYVRRKSGKSRTASPPRQ